MPESTKFYKVTASGLRVRKTPSLDGEIVGVLEFKDVVEFLQISEDDEWLRIKHGDLQGWSSYEYLAQFDDENRFSKIFDIVTTSAISKYFWKDRGRAAIGYYKGMALVFARMYCKLKKGDPVAVEMAKANTGNTKKDVLAYYADKFASAGMSNEANGMNTLRHLFVLMIGLGMRESSGKYCVGRDRSADNTTAETAEAGLFQTSYNARTSHPLLKTIFQSYKDNPDGFVDVFKDGVSNCKDADWENFGTGEGQAFQKISKECPAFAAEFAGLALRNIRTHWGPINNKHVEIRPECDLMLLKVQHILDSNDIYPV